MSSRPVPSIQELETLIIRTLAIVIDEDVEVLRFELRRRGDSMPADSYQLLEVMEKLQTTLSVDFDINKFQGYLKSVRRAARRLHSVLSQHSRAAA